MTAGAGLGRARESCRSVAGFAADLGMGAGERETGGEVIESGGIYGVARGRRSADDTKGRQHQQDRRYQTLPEQQLPLRWLSQTAHRNGARSGCDPNFDVSLVKPKHPNKKEGMP